VPFLKESLKEGGRMDKRELLEELKVNPKKIRFARICRIAEASGFQTRRGSGSHRIYLEMIFRRF
jgi:hypothetical protein